MECFDTHCHLTDPDFDDDRDAVLMRMREMGVRYCAVIGYDLESSMAAVRFAAAHEGVCAAAGIHPEHAATWEAELPGLRLLAKEAAAIGEIGLDFHWESNPGADVQEKCCVAQMELAYELNKPVCFHVRDSHMAFLTMLKAHRNILTPGIMHCFSGSWELAQEYLKLGYSISFAGSVTFRNARKLQEVACKVPMEKLLIETDSPYMSPEPVRGRRNEPGNVRYVLEKIAALRGMEPEELARITTCNAKHIYGI